MSFAKLRASPPIPAIDPAGLGTKACVRAPVDHGPGKQDTPDIGRKKVVTY
jgi:hypothetical protein